jgi:hypothetical protein
MAFPQDSATLRRFSKCKAESGTPSMAKGSFCCLFSFAFFCAPGGCDGMSEKARYSLEESTASTDALLCPSTESFLVLAG